MKTDKSVIKATEVLGDEWLDIEPLGIIARGAIPSKYPLPRTMEFVLNGYYKLVERPTL